MYAKQKPGFPSYNTLKNHFGLMADIKERAREWASQNENFTKVLDLIPATEVEGPARASDRVKEGWVYLLKSGEHYKIGRGDNLERRIKQVSVALPQKVELVHAIRTDDPSGIEAYWHNRFKEQRLNGEWFNLSQADIGAFKRRKFQ